MELCLAIISDTVWFTPTLFVMVALTALLWEVLRQKSHVLASASGLRPPGGSLRLDLDVVNQKMVMRLLFTVGFALITGIAARIISTGSNFALVYAVMFTGSAIALGLTLWTWNLMVYWRDSHLRVEGKRMVGRELNLLMLDGCRVFHDMVTEKIGKLDHIVVAPHALFLVETINWRKGKSDSSQDEHQVVFNGNDLRFPKSSTDQPLKHVTRNAKWLEKYLAHNTGIALPVHPVLTVPGWKVERTGHGEVTVVNPEELGAVVVDKASTPLYDAQRQRIINLLDVKCQYAPF